MLLADVQHCNVICGIIGCFNFVLGYVTVDNAGFGIFLVATVQNRRLSLQLASMDAMRYHDKCT